MGRPAGIHLIHKPVGLTSFATLQRFLSSAPPSAKKPLKACHAGTLDPFAEGLLLVLVGPATHLFEDLHSLPKTYEAEIRWGVETASGDGLSAVTQRSDPSGLSEERIGRVARSFVGWSEQVPPATSAKKIQGEPAYRKAHRGEVVVLSPSRVYLHSLQWLDHRLPETSRVRMVCRGGFYVRSFVRDLGLSLGTHAHVTRLRRPQIGPWTDPGPDVSKHLQGADILSWAPTRALDDAEVGRLRDGVAITPGAVRRPAWRSPDGFPDLAPRVGGLHRGRLAMLLTESAEGLRLLREFRHGL